MTTAYADVCNLGYLPCSGNQTEFCVHKAPKKISRNLAARDFSRRCFATNPLVQKSFENSIANIYLSPLHRRISERVLNIEEKSKSNNCSTDNRPKKIFTTETGRETLNTSLLA
jgi:hypothetical protein